MFTQKFQCPQGHEILANPTSRHALVTCEQCRQKVLSLNGHHSFEFSRYMFSCFELQLIAPDGPPASPKPYDFDQIRYALERSITRLQVLAEELFEQRNYSAEFPAEDADRLREALQIISEYSKRFPHATPT